MVSAQKKSEQVGRGRGGWVGWGGDVCAAGSWPLRPALLCARCRPSLASQTAALLSPKKHTHALALAQEEKPAEGEGEAARRVYSSRSFFQRLRLPDNVSPDQIKASTKDGVLTVTLPKAPQAEHKRTEIPVA